MKMPWVFLHAIKDYYEMPWLMSRYPGLKATFNLSASLIEQLQLYREPLKYDYFLNLWIQHPSKLTLSEREWLIKLFTAMQFETMVRPLERYVALYYQTTLTDQELIDLETVFILAWCGNYLRLNNDQVKALFEKKEGYTQEDKRELLETLSTFTQEILPFYGELQRQGIISISTTPYFHPILPLLVDMENAQRANSATALPSGACSLHYDAQEHVKRSIALYETAFGCKPNGFWPAEGAVDEKSVAIYKEHNIQWIATDEAILTKSLLQNDPSLKYKPYKFDGITIAFRDHRLSDLIGFEYRHMNGADASGNFMNALKQIAMQESDPTVFVILDGENAWEFYENNGWDFFSSLYTALSSSPWCSTLTMDEASSLKNSGVLDHLAPGSWIHGTFDTWVGHREKNRAWELIYQTRHDVETYQGEISDEVRNEILYHFLASECSDWFWWYGEDHVSDFSSEFDALFREHLIHIYRLMQCPIPSNLFEPINGVKAVKPLGRKPRQPITPKLGNRAFFEWNGSGIIDERQNFSTMDRVRGPIDIIYYGFDELSFYGAFIGEIDQSNLQVAVMIEESGEQFRIDPILTKGRVEFSFSREYLDGYMRVHLRFMLMQGETIIQSMPGSGLLYLDVDDPFTTDWFI